MGSGHRGAAAGTGGRAGLEWWRERALESVAGDASIQSSVVGASV